MKLEKKKKIYEASRSKNFSIRILMKEDVVAMTKSTNQRRRSPITCSSGIEQREKCRTSGSHLLHTRRRDFEKAAKRGHTIYKRITQREKQQEGERNTYEKEETYSLQWHGAAINPIRVRAEGNFNERTTSCGVQAIENLADKRSRSYVP